MSSVYEQRPWLRLYPEWVQPDLEMPFANGVEMFRARARANPDAPLLHYFEHTLTCAEVDRASDALAAAFVARGLARGDRVALYLQNVPQFLIALLATWKCGGSVVPLNPMFKTQEVHYHLADSGARALVALQALYEEAGRDAVHGTDVGTIITTSALDYLGASPPGSLLANAHRREVKDTEDFVALVTQFDGRSVPDPGLTPDDVAVLTYTSGTTGRPKGAMNTHGNIVFNSEVYRVWMQLGPGDVILGAAPLFHITGLIAHLGVALLAGLPLVLFYRFDPAEALRLIERWKCTFTVASITAFLALMEHPDIKTRDLATFRKVYSGGAPIAPAVTERFQEMTGAYIHNGYGLTETTSPSHAVPLGRKAPVDPESGALSVGVPVPNTLVKIVDLQTGQELPAGQVGELCTKGPQVVPGYWQRPEATAETFTDGYLHTGDVGKMDAQGWFYIVDRAKDMINVSGYKVWPREVEDYLFTHPAIREVAVVGVPDPYRGETVKAFVALRSGQSATPEEIIDFAKQRMAAYKYPRLVEIVDEIPKNLSGKVLRRELREREKARRAAATQGST
jgi:long-chain acyl-CoA synthetase